MNYPHTKKVLKTIQSIGLLTIVLTATLVVNFAYGEWRDPSDSANGGSVVAPLTTGDQYQIREDWLAVDGLLSTNENPQFILQDGSVGELDARVMANLDGIYFQHNLSNNPNSPNWFTSMQVQDNTAAGYPNFAKFKEDVHAARYCDENGNNCKAITDFGTTATGQTQAGVFSRPSSGPGAGDVTHTAWVTFNQPFASIPTISTSDIKANIILNCSGAPMTPQGTIRINNVTETGFQAQLLHYVSGCEYWRSDSFVWTASITSANHTYWTPEAWGTCSNTCGFGTQTRVVDNCIDYATQAKVTSSSCGVKPPTTQSCNGTTSCAPAPDPTVTCFVAGTQVTMADGTHKDIQDVTIGEQVLGSNGSVNTVLGYDRPMLGERLLYSINGGSYFVTAEHPFQTTDGWKSISKEAMYNEDAALARSLDVQTLEIGDQMIMEDGSVRVIESIDHTVAENQQLYNFKLDGNNTYYADQYTTHNKGGS